MSDRLVTVASFSQAIDAHVVKAMLESEGIECFLADENIVNANWLYSNLVGGVKVQVREADAENAARLIRTGAPEAPGAQEGAMKCPFCKSDSVYFEKGIRRAMFATWLASGFPILFPRKRWNCRSCGKYFRAEAKKGEA